MKACDVLLMSRGGLLLHAFMIPPRKTGTYVTSTSLKTDDVWEQDTDAYQRIKKLPIASILNEGKKEWMIRIL